MVTFEEDGNDEVKYNVVQALRKFDPLYNTTLQNYAEEGKKYDNQEGTKEIAVIMHYQVHHSVLTSAY